MAAPKSHWPPDTGADAGYYNGPIPGAFLRAPYLHNASVLTLAELVGLEPRRGTFYRGRNAYDLDGVGLKSPEVRPPAGGAKPGPLDDRHYFVFDAGVRGNSNRGHEFPAWGFRPGGPAADEKKKLADLVEYLKSL